GRSGGALRQDRTCAASAKHGVARRLPGLRRGWSARGKSYFDDMVTDFEENDCARQQCHQVFEDGDETENGIHRRSGAASRGCDSCKFAVFQSGMQNGDSCRVTANKKWIALAFSARWQNAGRLLEKVF